MFINNIYSYQITTCYVRCWQEILSCQLSDEGEKMKETDENNVNEIRIEINDSSSSHNNNFAITLKSKNVDVDRLLPMAKQWVTEHKQKTWQGV